MTWYQSKSLHLGLCFALVVGLAGCEILEEQQEKISQQVSLLAPRNYDFGGNQISVKSQESGEIMEIDAVVISEVGFVAIHRMTSGNQPGKLIGHSGILDPGEHFELDVIIDEPVEVGDRLAAVLYLDDGDHSFDPRFDNLVTADNGIILLEEFEIDSQR